VFPTQTYLGAVAHTNKVVARAIKQISALTRVQVEEDARHHNDLLLQAGLEEVEAVIDAFRQRAKVQPDVEGRVGRVVELEAHVRQAAENVVALVAEVGLQGFHLVAHFGRLEHGDRGFLEGHVGATVEVAAAGADGFDELLRADDPCNTPAWKTETLSQAVDDEDVVLVYVVNVVCCGDDGAVAVGCIVITAVELVHDQRGAVAADVLDLGELRVGESTTGRVARVGRQDHAGATGDLGSDVLCVNVVAVLSKKRNGNSSEVLKQAQHLIVRGVIRDEESKVSVSEHGSDTDETRAATRDNADVLPGVLACLALAVVLVVKVGNGISERLDTCCRAILTSRHGDVDVSRTIEATFDVIVDLRCSLAQVGPRRGILKVTMFVSTLSGPDYASTGARGIETSMGFVTFMGSAELPVHGRADLLSLVTSAFALAIESPAWNLCALPRLSVSMTRADRDQDSHHRRVTVDFPRLISSIATSLLLPLVTR
jgi:hypothetical protein